MLGEHYVPKLVVLDLAPEIIAAVSKVFPKAKLQGCLFHLEKRVKEKLFFKARRLNGATLRFREEVKKLIMKAATAHNKDEQQFYLKWALQISSFDEVAHKVVLDFRDKIRYYHTVEELRMLGAGLNYAYNNVTESQIGEVKERFRHMRWPRNAETAQLYINVLWSSKRSIKFKEFTDLELIAKTTHTPLDVVKARAKEAGLEIMGSYALSKSLLDKLTNKLRVMKPRSLEEAEDLITSEVGMEVKVNLITELLERSGFQIKFSKLVAREISIEPVNE